MNSNTILQSNLLDIIFENRNKDYGAYTLRKFYNNRLSIAVVIMMSVVVIFSLFQTFWSNELSSVTSPKLFDTPDQHFSKFENKAKAILFPARQKEKKVQKKNPTETTPEIVKDKNLNKSIASIDPPAASDLKITGNEELALGEEINFGGIGNKTGAENIPALPEKPKSSKPKIFNTPEIMPQYPGGLKALLAYLKRNLQAPDEIEEGKEISVKIKFVVNYNGQLESFKVLESGGRIFDNEVLRVLQKMPHWIPGKSNGENVSVYYTVPVKFTSDFYK